MFFILATVQHSLFPENRFICNTSSLYLTYKEQPEEIGVHFLKRVSGLYESSVSALGYLKVINKIQIKTDGSESQTQEVMFFLQYPIAHLPIWPALTVSIAVPICAFSGSLYHHD